VDLGRYWRVFRFVRDRLLDAGGTKDAAYAAAEANLGMPYSTVKKHYARMARSIEAAEAAGIDTGFLSPRGLDEGLIDVERFFQHAHLEREPLEADPEFYYESLFTTAERRQLQKVSAKLRRRLIQDRIELTALRPKNRK
jgi:hypothetical protein